MEACNELNKTPMHTTLHEVPHAPNLPQRLSAIELMHPIQQKNIIIIIILGSLRQKQASNQPTNPTNANFVLQLYSPIVHKSG
jgi:hypothetical protein